MPGLAVHFRPSLLGGWAWRRYHGERAFLPCSERWEGQPLTAPASYLVVPHHGLIQARGLPLDLCFQHSSSFLPSPVSGKDSHHPCEVLVPVRGYTSIFLLRSISLKLVQRLLRGKPSLSRLRGTRVAPAELATGS